MSVQRRKYESEFKRNAVLLTEKSDFFSSHPIALAIFSMVSRKGVLLLQG